MAAALFPSSSSSSSHCTVGGVSLDKSLSSSSKCNFSSVRFSKPHGTIRASATSTAERPQPVAYCSSSLYQDLGISMGASFQDIKSAYRKLARTCHPDVALMSETSSSFNFIKIQAAYSTLSDPQKRMDYDRNLFRRPQSSRSPFSFTSTPIYATASGYSRTTNNWETDQCW